MSGSSPRLAMIFLLAALLLPSLPRAHSAAVGQTSPFATPASTAAAAAYGHLPLSFEVNQGQASDGIDFVARGGGYSLGLSSDRAWLALRGAAPDASALLALQVLGGRATAAQGQERLPGTANYFLGNDPAQWHAGVLTYGRVRYGDVYPGVDLVYHGEQGLLEYDFVLAPGIEASAIRLAVGGATGLDLDGEGGLVLHTDAGDLRLERPQLYQDAAGGRQPVDGGYVMAEDGTAGFWVGAYDASLPLVIDPTLVYSTFLGGSGTDEGLGLALDSSGNAYVTGLTSSLNFPTTPGAFQTAYAGGANDAFVTKLNPTGTALVYSTYVGGSGDDEGFAVAVDGSGAYVAGFTSSTNFPITPGAFQAAYGGGSHDAFVTKLNPTGTALIYSTYLGGSGDDTGGFIAVDGTGNAYITGDTASLNFPITPGAVQPAFAGGTYDAFVTKLNPTGTALAYSTYLGGSDQDEGVGIAVDSTGNAYITGITSSTNFPTTPGAFQTVDPGGQNGYVTKLNPTGTALVYSTYLGPVGGGNQALGIAIDGGLNAYVTGLTSSGFPTTPGAFQTAYNGGLDGFVTKLNPAGTALVYSTYLGGSGLDFGHGIAVDGAGNAYVSGSTNSPNFPVLNPVQPAFGGGNSDAFVTVLNPTGTALVYSTFLGGSAIDDGGGIAVDGSGNAYLTGFTRSANFPTTPGAFQTAFGGAGDAFVAKIGAGAAPPPPSGVSKSCNPASLPAGGTTLCTITLGSAVATRTTITDQVPGPGGATVTGCSVPAGSSLACGPFSGSSGSAACGAAAGCPSGSSFTLSITSPNPGTLTETVTVTPPGGASQSFPLSGQATFTAPAPAGAPTKVCSPSNVSIAAGGTTSCTITLGAAVSTRTTITDQVTGPGGATITGCSAPAGSQLACGPTGSSSVLVNCFAAAGCPAGSTFTVTIHSSSPGTLSETLTITPPGGPPQTFPLSGQATFS